MVRGFLFFMLVEDKNMRIVMTSIDSKILCVVSRDIKIISLLYKNYEFNIVHCISLSCITNSHPGRCYTLRLLRSTFSLLYWFISNHCTLWWYDIALYSGCVDCKIRTLWTSLFSCWFFFLFKNGKQIDFY